jgi:hypothetical protein
VIFATTGLTMTASASQLLQNLPHTTRTGRGGTRIPATTLSFNVVERFRVTVAIQDNRHAMRPIDEAIKRPHRTGRT